MAATTGSPSSSTIRLYTAADGTSFTSPAAVACLSDGSISVEHSPRSVTCKDSAGFEEYEKGMRSFSADISGILKLTAGAKNGASFLSAAKDGGLVYFIWGNGNVGDSYIRGSAFVTNYTEDSPGTEETVTWSATLQGTGTLQTGTYS